MNGPKKKWRFAIGTTSLVPYEQYLSRLDCNRVTVQSRLHYLICDIDNGSIQPIINFLVEQLGIRFFVIQKTPHGWHVYTGMKMTWRELRYTLRRIPGVDPAWIGIGERRGYYYLADKDQVDLPWPVVRMTIHHAKKA